MRIGLPLVAAYDYFPYGMLMPGRYTNDTSSQCMLVTTTKLVGVWVNDPNILQAVSVKGAATINLMGIGFRVSAPKSGDGAQQTLSVQQGVEQSLDMQIESVGDEAFRASVSEVRAGTTDTVEIGSIAIAREGLYRLDFTPHNSTVYYKLLNNGNGAGSISLLQAYGWKQVLQPQTVVTRVCNDVKDGWVNGFNGQRKTNELNGVGGWNTAEFWEYDTKTATRKNRDPKPNPGVSEYSVFNGNPIFYSDPLGDTTGVYTDQGKYLGVVIPDKLTNAIVTIPANLEQDFMAGVNAWQSSHQNPTQAEYNAAASYVRSIGKGYAIDEFSAFQDKFKNAYVAQKAFGDKTEGKTFYFSTATGTKTVKKLYAEVGANVVLKDGLARPGNETSTAYSFNFCYPQDSKAEPNTVSYLHIHPLSDNTEVGYYVNSNFKLSYGTPQTPGQPSYPEDYGLARNKDYRAVMIDATHVVMYNTLPSQNININRQAKWGPPTK